MAFSNKILYDIAKHSETLPGFIPLLWGSSPIGVIPAKSGNCQWAQAWKGSATDGTVARSRDLPEDERMKSQRAFLRATRAAIEWEWLQTELGISRRTWEGWEIGRPIPYFQIARIQRLAWDAKIVGAFDEPRTRHGDSPRRIKFE